MDEQSIRINRFLAESGHYSRRRADELVAQGRVTVDGRRCEMGEQVSPHQRVVVDGQLIRRSTEKVYLMLNKPVGIVCTTDVNEPGNIVDFVNHPQRIFPIGRLDKDSTGLILLTNDGDIVNKILREENAHEKEYKVRLSRPCDDAFLQNMASGVRILGQTTKPCRVMREGVAGFRIILKQGLNRQIRRMVEALGNEVYSLARVRIMNIRLGDLPLGRWRNLTPSELGQLNRSLANSSNTPQAPTERRRVRRQAR